MKGEEIEIHLGKRLLERRLALSWSQNALAQELGVSTTQFRKYETGTNRISAEMLYKMAIILKVEVGFFYEGLPGVDVHVPLRRGYWSVMKHAENLEAIPAYETRKAVMTLIDSVTPPRNQSSPEDPS